MQNHAILVVSGKILETFFPLDSLEELIEGIERELSNNDIILSRSVATLCPERHITAPYFLQAGFEAQPAVDEDRRALALAASLVFGPTPPDALILCLWDEEQADFLKSFEGKTHRILLRFADPKNDPGLSPEVESAVEEILEAKDALANAGLTWEDCKPWRAWKKQFETFMGWTDDSDDGSQEYCDALPDYGATRGNDDLQSYSAAQDDEVPQACDAPQSDDESSNAADELARTCEYEHFKENSEQWNAALEKVLREIGLKCSAFKATETLDKDFRGLNNFYVQNRKEFAKLLSQNIRLIRDDDGVYYLCHAEHPELHPVDATGAISSLNIGGSASDDEEGKEEIFEKPPKVDTFETVVKNADFMRRLCAWQIERKELAKCSMINEDVIREREQNFREELAALDFYAWPYNSAYILQAEEYEAMSKYYEALQNAFKLMQYVSANPKKFSGRLLYDIAKHAGEAQCLVKSALIAYKIDVKRHGKVQRVAQRLLVDYAKNELRTPIPNLAITDEIPLESYEHIRQNEQKLCERLKTARESQKLWRELKYHAGQILALLGENDSVTTDRTSALGHWNKVAGTVTDLCQKYGVKYSSAELREALLPVLKFLPEEFDSTVEFGCVVQEIDEYEEAAEKDYDDLFEFSEPDLEPQDPPQVVAVRERYAGHKVVFIGGTPKDHIREKIENQFKVKVIWSETDHGESLDRLSPYLRDDDVKLFLIYIPWCSHKHSEEFAALAKGSAKDFVRVTKGTNPVKIAHAICNQIRFTADSDAQ